MHFGAWMRKEGIVPNPRKTALLVCPNGIGTSRMLQYQLEKLFSNIDILNAISKQEYESNIFDVDCIITTTEIEKGMCRFLRLTQFYRILKKQLY